MKMYKKEGRIHDRNAENDRAQNRESKVKGGIGSILVVPVQSEDEVNGYLPQSM